MEHEPDDLVSIIDYGAGNVRSIINLFDYLGIEVELVSTPAEISKSKKLLLPGVGAFDFAMHNLLERNLVDPIVETVSQGNTKILGVCLGLQLLSNGSEEGSLQGLGLIPGYVKALPVNSPFRIHMGWNKVKQVNSSTNLNLNCHAQRFYFAHSFYLETSISNILATTEFGVDIPAVVECDNVIGFQFHPEKSGYSGLRLMKDFAHG
jgi:glutamine amidotransferase